MTETETKQVSQKADALARYTKGKEAGAFYAPNWKPFDTVRVELHKETSDKMKAVAEVLDTLGDKFPLFVRACPLHPRPGVLESTAVENKEDLYLVISRITEQMLGPDPSPTPQYEHGLCDPDGCIIVQPFCNADASAVVSPYAHAVIGAGHDGVTAGSDTLQIVLDLSQATLEYPQSVLTQLDIDPSKVQLEFVSKLRYDLDMSMRGSIKDGWHFDDNHIVQLRGCPEGHMPIKAAPHPFTLSGSIVDGKTTVTHVITLTDGGDDEMARLEQTLREMDDITGVIVAHPSGSQGSHHAGQCLTWGVSYVISDTPKVGDTWVEVDGWVIDDPTIEPAPFDHYHWRDDFMQGLGVGLTKFTRQQGWLSNLFHQFMGSNVMRSPADTAYFAGVFAGFLPNAILSVSMGEMRHAPNKKKNTLPIDAVTFAALNKGVHENAWVSGNRKHYYMLIEDRPLTLKSMAEQLDWLAKMYSSGWEGGYGGTNYMKSTVKGLSIVNAVLTYTETPNKDNFIALLGAVNDAENIVHNNGFFLNKFLDKRAFDIGTNHRIGTSQTYLSSFYPSDFFAIYYAASHAYQHRGMSDEDIGELTDTTEITSFAIKKRTYQYQKDNPLFTRTDLPKAYSDMLVGMTDNFSPYSIHYAESKYTHSDKFIPCGASTCTLCQQIKIETMNTDLTIPLPTSSVPFDMALPTNEVDEPVPIEVVWEVDTDLELMVSLFKNNVYDDHVIPSVAQFFLVVRKHSLQNSTHPMVMKAIKHYANWMTNMPQETMVALLEKVFEMNGDE